MSEIRQAQEAISEGFICANCRRQFGGVSELLTHYELCQKKGGGGDENGASSGFKSIFGKARQKLKFESQQIQSQFQQQQPSWSSSRGPQQGSGFQDKSSPTPTYFNDFDTSTDVQGVVRSSFEDFRKIRSGRMERYAAESNKLKIRLSKLVSGLEKFPGLMTKSTAGFQDSSEWKAHEKSVVNWLEEKPVTRCPECTQAFSLLRRKHHCRLCGSILCDDCSGFIPLAESFEILHSERKIRESSACASITFRTCVHCARILRQESQSPFSKYNKKGADSTEKTLLEVYGTIREKMAEIDNLLPQLVTVVESIRSGETLYSREEGNSLRSKLLRATEQIDLLSKQISTLKCESSSMLMLQQRIRQNCVAYIRDFIRSVPVVPDAADDSSSTSSSIGGASSIILTGDGWSISAPEHHDDGSHGVGAHSIDIDDNPVQQQIKNVKFYIEQAKAAGKMDEVEMLVSSLRDLLLWQNDQENKF
ncbi:rabenosyn-5 [Folsomia candida]|uniref:rabenosyn-5 n=1 Tax=Folsomia candida TaxID=158441 RepID=UPI000B8FB798|nr:rabenosyn-5 [Folsomia candida]